MQTKEEKVEYQKKYRVEHKEETSARMRAYSERPDIKARDTARRSTSEYKACRKEYNKAWRITPVGKAKTEAHNKIRYATPEGRAAARAYKAQHRDKSRTHAWRRHGIDMNYWNYQLYLDVLQTQEFKCVGCGRQLVAERSQVMVDSEVACVDHNHITGKVRGLLCHKCNKGIGMFGDNPVLLRTLADYLERNI